MSECGPDCDCRAHASKIPEDVVHEPVRAAKHYPAMTVLAENPPPWIMAGCMSAFRINPATTVWTYGNTIYNPGGKDLPDHVVAHETWHAQQQESFAKVMKHTSVGLSTDPAEFVGGKDEWWKEYLSNPRFRLEQEAEAYGKQYRFYLERIKDRNARAKFLFHLSGQLSGPLYQVALSQAQAKAMIEVLSGQKTIKQVV